MNIPIRQLAVGAVVDVADVAGVVVVVVVEAVVVDVDEGFRRKKGVAWDDAGRPCPCWDRGRDPANH